MSSFPGFLIVALVFIPARTVGDILSKAGGAKEQYKSCIILSDHKIQLLDTLQIEFLPWGEAMELARAPPFNFKCGYTQTGIYQESLM